MASELQIKANRINAQKSTGPKTAEGKAASAKNATKHGLFARKDIVISENQAEFDALRDEMLKELDPVGAMEAILAERIVSLTWRIKRAAQMHDEVIDVKIRAEINRSNPILSKSLITGQPSRLSKNTKRCYDDLALGLIAKWDFEADRVLERLSMYERRFEASLFKTMGELKKLQDARKQEEVGADPCVFPGRPHGVAPTITAAYHGQDARETQGRDDLPTECEKQSQSAAGREGLIAYEKREYELLLGATPTPNEANESQQKTEIRRQMTDDGGQRRKNLPFGKVRAGVCRY